MPDPVSRDMSAPSCMVDKRRRIDAALDAYLPPEDRPPEALFRAMRYSVIGGGKRLRPILTLSACEAVGGDPDKALPTACAIEFIHAFSLIHDDLPALDNDDLRRGKPTSHKAFGEAMAILAGDALLTFAFEIICGRATGVPPEVLIRVIGRLAASTGIEGMIAGQVADIEAEGKTTDIDALRFIHNRKTGALIEAAVVCGGMIGGASDRQLEALGAYGRSVGLAFQIADDILDLVSDSGKLGKTVGSDLRKEKATYPAIVGLERSKELARSASDDAVLALSGFDDRADPLRAIARFVVERES